MRRGNAAPAISPRDRWLRAKEVMVTTEAVSSAKQRPRFLHVVKSATKKQRQKVERLRRARSAAGLSTKSKSATGIDRLSAKFGDETVVALDEQEEEEHGPVPSMESYESLREETRGRLLSSQV